MSLFSEPEHEEPEHTEEPEHKDPEPAPTGKLPPVEEGTGAPTAPQHPPVDGSKEEVHQAFLHTLRALKSNSAAIKEFGSLYSVVANEAHTWVNGFLGRAESAGSPNHAGA